MHGSDNHNLHLFYASYEKELGENCEGVTLALGTRLGSAKAAKGGGSSRSVCQSQPSDSVLSGATRS